MSFSIFVAVGLFICCLAAVAGQMETPTLQWGDSKRADGTVRHWNPEPLIDLRATLVCVAYRPLKENGERWYAVGMTPPKLLAKMLLNTKPELDECHKHGIKVIGYADAIMFHPEMLEPEGIAVDDLYAIDRKGERVINAMWDKEAPVACVKNPRWIELQKQVARVTAEAGFDGLQFDVYPYAIEPGYQCCCPHCKDAWSRHSKSLFGSPQPMPGLDSGKLDFRRPVDRALKTWRLRNFVDFVKAVEADVRKSHPNFIIIMNHGGGTPDFTYEAVNGALKYPSTELWHLRLGDDSSLYLYSSTEAANGAKMIGLINFAEQMKPDYRYRAALAEAYAAGGTFYAVTGKREDGGALRTSHDYCDFFRLHQDWYNGTRSEAEVAVLYSWRDQAFMQGDSVTEAKVEFDPKRDHYQRAAAVLARMGVPHDCVIVEKGLSGRGLGRYKIVVVPELSIVSDKDAAALEGYVRAGGRLLVIGEMGVVTESGQDLKKRDQSLLTAWTGKPATSMVAKLGKGVIACATDATTDGIVSDANPPSGSAPLAIPVRPLSPEFRSACESVGLSSQIEIKSATPIETTIRAKGRMRAIHLIRFGSTDALTDRPVMVDYKLPKGYRVREVTVWSPDFPTSAMSRSWKNEGDRLHVRINRVDTYALVGIVLQPAR